jgi:putative N6-adenine-specific DNA methylase
MTDPVFPVYADTHPSLVFYLKKELEAIGISGWTETGRGLIAEAGDLDLYRLLIHSRLALRFYKVLHRFEPSAIADLAKAGRALSWVELLTLRRRFEVKPLFSLGSHDVNEVTDALRDGIMDYYREEFQTEPGEDDPNTPMNVGVAVLENDEVLVMLDAAGEPLSNRGYRVRKTSPLDEVMAAGLTRLAGWDPATVLINPMCGDGVIATEAAFMAKNKAPALIRKEFDILHWPYFRSAMWKSILDDAQRLAGKEGIMVEASDPDGRALDQARINIREARLARNIHIKKTDPSRIFMPAQRGLILMHFPTPTQHGAITWRNIEIDALISKMKSHGPEYRLAVLTDDPVLKSKLAFKTQKTVELTWQETDFELLIYQF